MEPDTSFGIVLRTHRGGRGLKLQYDAKGFRFSHGQLSESLRSKIDPGVWHRLVYYALGPMVVVILDGEQIGSFADIALTDPGRVAIYCKKGRILYRKLEVTVQD